MFGIGFRPVPVMRPGERLFGVEEVDFNPCMKHKVVRKAVRMFAEAELGPIAHDIDRDARFPWEVVEKMRPLQFFGLQAPKAYGGAEMDTISYAIVIEEISRVSAAVGLCLTVHNSVGIYPIVRFGTEEQKTPLPAGDDAAASGSAPSA